MSARLPLSVPALVLLVPGLFAAAPAHAVLPADHVVTTTADTRDATIGDGICADAIGDCSLRAAIQEANAIGGRAVIELQAGATYLLSVGFAGENLAAGGDLDVTADLHLRGLGAVIDANSLDRAFDVRPGGRLVLSDLTITRGLANNASGGAVRNEGNLKIVRSVLTANAATGTGASGGAILNSNGFVEVIGSTLVGNTATRAGGAIEATAGTTLVLRSELIDNSTGSDPGNGGAIHLTGAGSVHLSDSLVQGNMASLEGGGLWNSSLGTMTVDGCDIVDNLAMGIGADDGGGGVFNDGGTMVVTDSVISGNQAVQGSGSGGGAFNNAGELYLVRTVIDGNTSTRAGGGVEALAGYTAVVRSTLSNNSTGNSPGNGGGLHLTGAGEVLVARTTVTDNAAGAEGGGLWNSADGSMRVIFSDIERNTATGALSDQGGGGLFNAGGFLQVEDCYVADNTATGAAGSGGGLLNDLGVAEVVRTTFERNTAVRAGGGVEANVGTTSLSEVVLHANVTGASPGNGGGLHLTGAGYVSVDQCTVTENVASNAGGGLWNSSTGVMEVTATTGGRNQAPVGPNLYSDGGLLTVNGNPVSAL
jgi:CSLREA domain-containing protein